MCERLRKYIDEVRKISISDAAREMGEHKETVRTWLNGVQPRKPKVEKVREWSGGYVQPNDFYQPAAEGTRANGHDPHPVIEGAAA